MMKKEKNHVSHLGSSKESYSMKEKTGREMIRTGTEKTGLTKSVKNTVMKKPVRPWKSGKKDLEEIKKVVTKKTERLMTMRYGKRSEPGWLNSEKPVKKVTK